MLDGSTLATASTLTNLAGYIGTSQGNSAPGAFAGAAQSAGAGGVGRVVIKAT